MSRIVAAVREDRKRVVPRAIAVASILICALSISARANAATYYVSPSGSDSNSCTSALSTVTSSQKATIAAAVACLRPGDTLLIRSGTYTGAANVIDSQLYTVPSGTSWATPITISGFPGESVVIKPPQNVSGIRLTSGAPSYIVFRDFTIDMGNSAPGADADGIFLYTAHHNRFENLEVKNGASFGIHFGDLTPFNEVLNCRIHDNGYSGSPSTVGHGLYITGSDNLFEGNDVYNNQGYGFHIYNNAGSRADPSRNVVRRNRIHGNGMHGSPAYGVVISWGSDNLVYNNVIYANRGGIQVYTGATATGIYNNTVYGNNDEGIALQYYGSGLIVRNNIVYANGAGIVDYSGSGTPTLEYNLTTDPGFVGASAGDFSILATSRARDAGVSVSVVVDDYTGTPRPQGGQYDVGAFEYRGLQTLWPPDNLRIVKPGL